MRLTPSHSRAPELILLAALAASAATRPHYGGTLRLEIREAVESPDPIKITGFTPAQWDAPQHAVYTADETAPGGRPFIDSIDFRMGRRLADQTIDLDAGKAYIVEIDASESRRNAAARKLWTSSPVRILLLLFGARVDDPRVREALALAVDRAAIYNVLLQRQ